MMVSWPIFLFAFIGIVAFFVWLTKQIGHIAWIAPLAVIVGLLTMYTTTKSVSTHQVTIVDSHETTQRSVPTPPAAPQGSAESTETVSPSANGGGTDQSVQIAETEVMDFSQDPYLAGSHPKLPTPANERAVSVTRESVPTAIYQPFVGDVQIAAGPIILVGVAILLFLLLVAALAGKKNTRGGQLALLLLLAIPAAAVLWRGASRRNLRLDVNEQGFDSTMVNFARGRIQRQDALAVKDIDDAASVAWSDEASQLYTSGLYPSINSATVGVAAFVKTNQSDVLSSDAAPQKLVINVPAYTDDKLSQAIEEFASQCLQTLRETFPNCDVEKIVSAETPRKSGSEQELLLNVKIRSSGERNPSMWDRQSPEMEYMFMVEMLGPDPKAVKRLGHLVLTKPWVDTYETYSDQFPNRLLLRTQNTEFHSSMEAAHDTAAAAAVDPLLEFAEQYNTDRGISIEDEAVLREHLEARLIRGDFTVDRFVQPLNTKQGTVYRAAILMDLKPDDVENLYLDFSSQQSAQLTNRLSQNGVYAGLAVLVLAIVVCMNSLTSGYYRGWILLGTVGLGLVAILFIG